MKRAIVFVLTTAYSPYMEMTQTSMETWDSVTVDGVRTVFYTGKSKKPDTDRVISFGINESYATMGYKDLLAYEWALKQPDWDYMVRVNSSCYVHKRRLLDFVQSLPEEKLMLGLRVEYTPGVWYLWGGGYFIMSRDVVQTLVDNATKWNHGIMEDVAMSLLAVECGIELNGGGRACSINKRDGGWTCIAYGGTESFEFADFSGVNQQQDQFLFRVKCDGQREVDLQVMRELFAHLPK